MEYDEYTVINFGRYKKKMLRDVPREYLLGLKKNPNGCPDKDLLRYVEKLINEPEEDPNAEYTPETKILFGRYKNKRIMDIPSQYLMLMQNNPSSCHDKKLLAFLGKINPERTLSFYLQREAVRLPDIGEYSGFAEFAECTKDTVMTFGEHKGKKVGELPPGYLFEFYVNPKKCPSKKLLSYIKRNLRGIVLEKNNLREIPLPEPPKIKQVRPSSALRTKSRVSGKRTKRARPDAETQKVLVACGIKTKKCLKEGYVSMESAQLAISVIEIKRGRFGFLRAYLCERCDRWHMTGISQEKWEQTGREIRKDIERRLEQKKHRKK